MPCRRNGVRSIDVGCGQINLMHHPDAFPSLEVAFDPQANAAYAAKFLKELFARTGDWNKAAGMYHSATPGLGDEYQRKVLAVWPEEQHGLPARSEPPRWRRPGAPRSPPARSDFMRAHRSREQGRGSSGSPHDRAPPGRGLDAYRAAPVGLAYQTAARRAGG